MSSPAAIADRLIELIEDKWTLAGHNLTGSFISSLDWTISEEEGITINIWGLPYGRYVSEGIPADRIPYTRGGGRGGRSKYITGLWRYGQMRLGLDDRSALRFAFAVAEKHSREGMPGSSFLEEVEAQAMEEIDGLVFTSLDKTIEKNM